MKYVLAFLLLVLTACQTVPSVQTPVPGAVAVEPPQIALYWENTTEPHPERASWSKVVIAGFNADLEMYGNASDITEICPKFKSLSNNDRLKALGEFMVALFYYESGFNPRSESVDVGKPNDKGSWSVGLGQMSANDSSAKEVGVSYEELKDPHLNILVVMIQLKKQIEKRNKFLLDNTDSMRYWAIILKGNKYNKIPDVKARVLKYAPKCA